MLDRDTTQGFASMSMMKPLIAALTIVLTSGSAASAATAAAEKSGWHIFGGGVAAPAAGQSAAAPANNDPAQAPSATPQAGPVPSFHGREYIDQAKYGLEDARRIALKAHPGTVTDSELGPGKSGALRYVFKIGGVPVAVDATTGQVMNSDK